MDRNYDTHTDEYLVRDRDNREDIIIKYMMSKDEINHLLNLTGKSHLRFSQSVDITRIDGRLLFNIDIQDKMTRSLQRLHIDVISGAPTYEQVADCVYGSGADADQKMIIYERHFDFKYTYHFGYEHLVAELISLANANGISISLVGAETIKNGNMTYKLINDAFDTERKESGPFPTRRQILEGEFWSSYYHLHWFYQGAGPVESLDSALSTWEPWYSLGGKRTKARWGDDGLFMCVEGKLDEDDMKFLQEHVYLLQNEYMGCPINVKVGDELVISVRVLDVPMKDLIEMTPKEKWGYGEYVYNEEFRFTNVLREALIKYEQIKGGNSVEWGIPLRREVTRT